MARERSHVRKRKRGCLSGCLVNVILLFGVAALLFVAGCSISQPIGPLAGNTGIPDAEETPAAGTQAPQKTEMPQARSAGAFVRG